MTNQVHSTCKLKSKQSVQSISKKSKHSYDVYLSFSETIRTMQSASFFGFFAAVFLAAKLS